MRRAAHPWRSLRWPLVVLVLVAIVAAIVFSDGPTRPVAESVPAAEPPPVEPGFVPRRPAAHAPAPGCAPRADRECIGGDAWWIDGCGEPHEVAESCELRRCEDGACEALDESACTALGLGRCDGEVARGCSGGLVYERDCGADGRRCVMTEEGPVCRERTADDCEGGAAGAHCDGSVLVRCVEGRWRRLDCRTVGGSCGATLLGVQCLAPVVPGSGGEDCGACGCPPATGDERCNGRDDDGDGFIDEHVDCGTIDIVAFLVTDGDDTPYTRQELEEEIERVNELFARDDALGLSFRLADVLGIDRPELLELDEPELQELLASGVVSPEREAFYVPVVFVDELLVEQVPRPGLATPPNGMCGGHRRVPARQPPHGLVVIAKRRWPTTVAHEIGHFFGLCHTHMDEPSEVATVAVGERGEVVQCTEACTMRDDGICDTPVDPGPDQCAVDPTCAIHCSTADRPDAFNVMGYYADCRTRFTTDQALMMRQGLALRRGWHPCIFGEGCGCDPGTDRCPSGMSCFRFVDGEGLDRWQCGLDGPALPGGLCKDPGDCSKGSICVGLPSGDSHCLRACTPTSGCDCRSYGGLDVPVCSEDLPGSE